MQNQLVCFENMAKESYPGETIAEKEAAHIVTGMQPEEYDRSSVLQITLGPEDFIRPIVRPVKLVFVKRGVKPPDLAPQYLLVSFGRQNPRSIHIAGLHRKAEMMLTCLSKDYSMVIPLRGNDRYSRKILSWGLDISMTRLGDKVGTIASDSIYVDGIVIGGRLYTHKHRYTLYDYLVQRSIRSCIVQASSLAEKSLNMADLEAALEESYAD